MRKGHLASGVVICLAVAALLGGCESKLRAQNDRPSGQDRSVAESKMNAWQPFIDGSEQEIIDTLQDNTDFAGAPNLDWFSLLLDIWYERQDSHPEFAWDRLRAPRVKVVLGSQLAQAYRNGIIPLNSGDIRSFALANYASADSRVTQRSILLIGKVGNADDIPLLAQLAQLGVRGRPRLREAVTALSYMCDDEAVRTIDRVTSQASAEEREFAKGLLANREHLLRSWCR